MRFCRAFSVASLAALTLLSAPAEACMFHAPIELSDIKYAEVVVLGHISNYALADESSVFDYAKFDILIDEVLMGKAARTISVTWDNSTFEFPESMPSGQLLIASRDPRSGTLPLRGPSATIVPNPELDTLTVLQAPCSDPFIFASDSDEAREILKILHR